MIDLEEKFKERKFFLMCGDSLEKLKEIPDNSIDSIVTDPPYGLGKEPEAVQMLLDWIETGHHDVKSKKGFMGKNWDAFVPQPQLWHECLRVLKPGGHLLSFAGTRTYDLVVLGLRLAGFEIRDQLAWVYASGMPKALDVSKAIDKSLGVTRKTLGTYDPRSLYDGINRTSVAMNVNWRNSEDRSDIHDMSSKCITEPATEEAKQWDGWKSSLKPAMEPIVMARKPLDGTIAQNVLKWHTGALNIDACRISTNETYSYPNGKGGTPIFGQSNLWTNDAVTSNPLGRFPSNFVHDGSEEVLGLFPESNGAGKSLPQVKITGYGDKSTGTGKSDYLGGDRIPFDAGSGSAARFFFAAKATSADRHSGMGDVGSQFTHGVTLRKAENSKLTGNNHPTVKPMSLMCWLVKMVTPVGGICLDPFNGSGSTGKAAMVEGMKYIGIDLSQEYIDISEKRIQYAIDNKDTLIKEMKKKEASKNTTKPTTTPKKEPKLPDLDQLFE